MLQLIIAHAYPITIIITIVIIIIPTVPTNPSPLLHSLSPLSG